MHCHRRSRGRDEQVQLAMQVQVVKHRTKAIAEFNDREWPKADREHYGSVGRWSEKEFRIVAREKRTILGSLHLSIKRGVCEIHSLIVANSDPAGQQSWSGVFRLVAYVRADIEPEVAADPMLGEVGWSWLTEALDAPGYAAASGTVTRVITEGYGAKAGEFPATGFELRASWSPEDESDLAGHVVAWCACLAAAACVEPPGTRALAPRRAEVREYLLRYWIISLLSICTAPLWMSTGASPRGLMPKNQGSTFSLANKSMVMRLPIDTLEIEENPHLLRARRSHIVDQVHAFPVEHLAVSISLSRS